MKLVNLTPHAIVLRTPDGQDVTVPPSGTVARVASTPGAIRTVSGMPVPVAGPTAYGMVEGLPEPATEKVRRLADGKVFAVAFEDTLSLGGTKYWRCLAEDGESWTFDEDHEESVEFLRSETVYVVSAIVLARVSRPDVFAPGTGPNDGAIRNDKGQVVAVTRLVAAD